ncbi:hypothetical protein LOTGIDRAFT_144142, partial [Lottia gigantea]
CTKQTLVLLMCVYQTDSCTFNVCVPNRLMYFQCVCTKQTLVLLMCVYQTDSCTFNVCVPNRLMYF